MKSQHTYQLTFLDAAFSDLRNLRELANKIKRPPKVCSPPGGVPQKKERLQKEAAQISCISPQAKYTKSTATPQVSESEILRLLNKTSSLCFTTVGIQKIAQDFGTTESHIRHLISSIVTSKYKR